MQKSFDKIQRDFMIKIIENVGPKGTDLNSKVKLTKLSANIILNGEKLKAIQPKSGTRLVVYCAYFLSTLCLLKVLARAIR